MCSHLLRTIEMLFFYRPLEKNLGVLFHSKFLSITPSSFRQSIWLSLQQVKFRLIAARVPLMARVPPAASQAISIDTQPHMTSPTNILYNAKNTFSCGNFNINELSTVGYRRLFLSVYNTLEYLFLSVRGPIA